MLRTAAFLLASTVALAACQSTGTPSPRGMAAYADDPRLGEPVDRICFASTIDGFSNNERDTVVLREGRDEYMIEVFGACPELENAFTIGIDSATGCLTNMDAIIIGDTLGGSGIGPRRCTIKEMRKWDPKAKAAETEADAADGDAAPAQ